MNYEDPLADLSGTRKNAAQQVSSRVRHDDGSEFNSVMISNNAKLVDAATQLMAQLNSNQR